MNNTLKRAFTNGSTLIDIKALSSALNKVGIHYKQDEIYNLGATGSYVEGKMDDHDYLAYDTKEGIIAFTCNNENSYGAFWGVGFYPNDAEKQGFFIGHKPLKNIKRIFSDPELVNDNNYKTTVARINDALSRVNDLSPAKQVGADNA